MKIPAALRLAAVALATGALLVPNIGPANAAVTYPPSVSTLYASPFLSGGYASVSVYGNHLTSGLTVKASRGSQSASGTLSVDSSGTIATGMVKVGSLLPSTAGQYSVDFLLKGTDLTGVVTTTQTYTVGTLISIKSFSVVRKSYGLYISGKAAKYAPVKVKVTFGSKTYGKTVTANSNGYFHYRLYKTTKGTYVVTAKVAANKKYFSEKVSLTYVRS